MTTEAEACPWCGEADLAGGPTCVRCGGSLLVDLVSAAVPDARLRFYAGKKLSDLGSPAPSFTEVKAGLLRGGVVAGALPRPFAREAVSVLRAAGVEASFAPHQAVSNRISPRVLLAAGGAALVVLATVGIVAVSRDAPVPEPAPVAASPAESAIPDPARPLPLTTQEIGRRAMAAVTALSCGDHLGSGFFIDHETVITNAHVTCANDDAMTVELRDGRRLIGTTVFRDPWLDVARVRVVGAGVIPLPVGLAADLEAGDRLVFIGSPKGLTFTLHEGTVSYVGRSLFGVGYLQINGDVNPGNSGGPVVDAFGRAVGIVSLKVTSVDGIGLALPLEYAVPPQGEARARWETLLREVELQNQREIDKYKLAYDEPRLVGVEAPRGEPLPIILQRWPEGPHATVERVELRRGGQVVCTARATFKTWVPLAQGLSGQSAQLLQWVLRYGVGDGELQIGAGQLDDGCPLPALYQGGELALVRSDGDHGLVRLAFGDRQAAALADAQRRASVAQRQDDDQERMQEAEKERYWRTRFAQVRHDVDSFDANLAKAQAEIERLDRAVMRTGSFRLKGESAIGYQKLKDYVASADERRTRAEEALRELEREAANEDVPLEWRSSD